MSSHKGKAKAKPTAKTAGTKKKAVMNSRNPKKPMAISGDTMSNYAMYKKGGKVKKYKEGGPGDGKKKKPVDLGDDLSISNNVQSFFKDPSFTNAVRVAGKINPITQAARLATEAITRTGAALGNEKMKKQAEERDRKYEANRRALAEQKKGGKVKRYKVGGSKFPDLTGDNKVTQADVLKGRGVFKKGGKVKKYDRGGMFGIWKKEKTINEDGSSITNRVSTNPITGNVRNVRVERSGDGDKTKTVKIASKKMGGKIKSKKK